MSDFDAVIIGGGPAGLATAIAVRRQGMRVAVLECNSPGIDKACGEGLMPDSLRALCDLGVHFGADEGFAFHGIRFIGDGHEATARFPNGHALGMRRVALHHTLAQHAEAAGVELLWNAHQVTVAPGGVRTGNQRLRCEWVIGADGSNSRVRKDSGLAQIRHERKRFGFRRHYRIAPWTEHVEIYWGPSFQIYITPVAADEVCVAVIAGSAQTRVDAALRHFPDLESRLSNVEHASHERGGVSVMRRLHAVQRGNVALIGDASGSVDAITGEGLCLSFRQSMALAKALAAGDLGLYQQEHERLAQLPRAMASLMLMLGAHPGLRRRVLHSFAASHSVFDRFLAVHVGERPPKNIGLQPLLRLGWGMLTV